MTYVKLTPEGKVELAPRNLGNIVNFDQDPALLSEHGFKPYLVDTKPACSSDQVCFSSVAEEGDCIRRSWTLVLKNASLRATELRRQRDQLLAKSDFYLMADYPLSPEHRAAVIAYRQALRDLPATATWPFKICFPSLTL